MNTYSIEQLLIGKRYRSNSNPLTAGEIVEASERSDVYVENGKAYLVRYRVDNSIIDEYATIGVKTEDF